MAGHQRVWKREKAARIIPTVARLLLENGAQVDLRCNDGGSPLYVYAASQNNHPEFVTLLYGKKGAVLSSQTGFSKAARFASASFCRPGPTRCTGQTMASPPTSLPWVRTTPKS